MNLYPHNQQAYEAVMKHYAEGNRKAAVIQSTGTGKSFVGGAVASHFGKVLVVAPNDYVLLQAVSTTPHANTATYTLLSIREEMPTGYDLIWFDEFHRIGAPTWKSGVDKVIEANPQAKILGTTATPDRALEQRNMADEFFEGDVVSNMTLTDAWVNHILRVPIYVTGVVSMGSAQADYTERINASKRINATQKKEATALLDNIVRDWSYSYGVPQILYKYIDNEVERMIVFAQTINKLDEVVSSIRPWFNEAGIKCANVYSAHSGMGSDAKKQLEAFENDTTEGVKVLVCVDMLNEGIHVDRVDAVMLLRSTISKNLYMQQIGRCFAVGQKHQPIILDLADNLTTACGYEGIYDAQKRYIERTQTEIEANRVPDEFMIIDTLKETRELISKIDKQIAYNSHGYWTFERCKEEAKKYTRRSDFHKQSPAAYQAAHKNKWLDEICTHMQPLRNTYTKKECIEIAKKYSRRSDWKKNDKSSFSFAYTHGWIEECCAHMQPKNRWTLEACKKEAKKYSTKKEWEKKSLASFSAAHKHKWTEECCAHMKNVRNYYNDEQLAEIAHQYNTQAEWRRSDSKTYSAARSRARFKDMVSHMKQANNKLITLDEMKESASRYSTRKEWRENAPNIYYAAMKRKHIKECCQHMREKVDEKKYDECKRDAMLCSTYDEWKEKCPSTYRIAVRNGWRAELTIHMQENA